MTCPNCGAANPDNAEFCQNCGTALPRDRYPSEPQTSWLAVASLVLSIVGFVFCFSAVIGIILGYVALGQIRQSGGRIGGAGLAKAGIIVGFVAIVLTIIFAWIFFTVFTPRNRGPVRSVTTHLAPPSAYPNIVSRYAAVGSRIIYRSPSNASSAESQAGGGRPSSVTTASSTDMATVSPAARSRLMAQT